jgi:hypothetical protein
MRLIRERARRVGIGAFDAFNLFTLFSFLFYQEVVDWLLQRRSR